MRRIVFIAALASTLGGCVTAAEQAELVAAADDDKCQSYGAHPGSDGYTLCRMGQQNRHDRDWEEQRAANDAMIERGVTMMQTGHW